MNRKLLGMVAVVACALFAIWTTTVSAYRDGGDNDVFYTWAYEETGVATDAQMILGGVKDKKHFSETASFWTGTWAMGYHNSFFRPLPSTIWWLMFHNLGPNSLPIWLGVLAISHFVVALLLWGFLCELFKSISMGTMVTVLWLTGLAEWLFGFTASRHALILWIDHIETWIAAVIVGTLWLFLRYVRTSERRWIAWACAAFVLGATIKEQIYVVPVLAALVLWHEKKLADWRKLFPFGVVAVCTLVYRSWALYGEGIPRTGNGAWMNRALTETFFGAPGATALRHEMLPFAVAAAVLFGLCWATGRAAKWRALWAISAVAFAGAAAWFSRGLDDPFYYQLLGGAQVWIAALTILVWALLVWTLFVARNRSQWFGWGWVVIAYLPLLLAPNTKHIFYIPSIGWAIVLGFALRYLGIAVLAPYAHAMLAKRSASRSASPGTTSVEVAAP